MSPETLVDVAESLSTAAANLSVVAEGLTEAASSAHDTTPVGELRHTADENAARLCGNLSRHLMEHWKRFHRHGGVTIKPVGGT